MHRDWTDDQGHTAAGGQVNRSLVECAVMFHRGKGRPRVVSPSVTRGGPDLGLVPRCTLEPQKMAPFNGKKYPAHITARAT